MNRLQGFAGSKLDRPGALFAAPKAIIEALNNVPEGSIAYATDTNEFGSYNGASWTWGQGGGSGDMLKSVYDADNNGVVDDSESAQSIQSAGIDPNLLSVLVDGDLLRWNEDDLQFESWPFPATGDVNGPAGATVGNIVTFDLSTGKRIRDSGIPDASLGRFLIDPKVLSAGDGIFDFQDIPGGYSHLEIELDARSDRAGFSSDSVSMKFNNDAGNNYVYKIQWVTGTTPGTTQQVTAGPPPTATFVTAATSPADWFSNSTIKIFDYASTNKFRGWQARSFQSPTNSGNFFIYDAGGLYLSKAAAISRITLAPVNGTNFKQHSTARLYGIK